MRRHPLTWLVAFFLHSVFVSHVTFAIAHHPVHTTLGFFWGRKKLVVGGVLDYQLVWETISGFPGVQRLRLDSGYTRLRPSTEFVLNFTYFHAKASSDCEVFSRPRDSRGTHAVRTRKADITLGLVSGRHRFGVCVA